MKNGDEGPRSVAPAIDRTVVDAGCRGLMAGLSAYDADPVQIMCRQAGQGSLGALTYAEHLGQRRLDDAAKFKIRLNGFLCRGRSLPEIKLFIFGALSGKAGKCE